MVFQTPADILQFPVDRLQPSPDIFRHGGFAEMLYVFKPGGQSGHPAGDAGTRKFVGDGGNTGMIMPADSIGDPYLFLCRQIEKHLHQINRHIAVVTGCVHQDAYIYAGGSHERAL